MFSSNQLGHCSQERWKLLSASIFEKNNVNTYVFNVNTLKKIKKWLDILYLDISSDEEWIKAKYKRAILKMHFLREQFRECIIWGSHFENVFFEGDIQKMSFLREQFWKCIFWENNFDNYLSWLLIGMAADWDSAEFWLSSENMIHNEVSNKNLYTLIK